MSRMKALFAALVLVTAMSALAPSASAVAKGVVIASGSSALWQTMALAAYNGGNCVVPKAGLSCSHYTDNASFELHDTRPGKRVKGTADTVDKGDIWIVWDSTTGPNVWAYIKVDSVVGNRCFFANPACNIQSPTGYNWGSAGQKISASLWGPDTINPPAAVEALFKNPTTGLGVKVNSAGTDIRPEDAAFAECRVNSKLGAGSPGFGDGLDGLGYNSVNASGKCPAYSTSNKTNGPLVGSAIASGYPGSSSTANVLAFNISGKDPFDNLTVPAYTVISMGASPVTFIYSRNGASGTGLNQGTGVTGINLSNDQASTLFSGANCDAAHFGVGASPNPIYAYLREPLSGTMNTTEATVFRRPVQTLASNGTTAPNASQETGVGANNPLKNLACGTAGFRSRGIGTGEVVNSVLNSQSNNGVDGFAYAFFSFGNVKPVAGNAGYGYATIDGVDPIGPFNSATKSLYPNQELPLCSAPCAESQFWSTGASFPNVRNGSYGAWSVLRMVATAAAKAGVTALATASHQYVVLATPDYVPALRTSVAGNIDPGLTIFRAHYQQCDGNGTSATCPGVDGLGPAPKLGSFNVNNNPTGLDAGGDMGGCIGSVTNAAGSTTFTVTETNGTQVSDTWAINTSVAETNTTGIIQIGIDTDVNGTKGTSNVSCSNGPDRN